MLYSLEVRANRHLHMLKSVLI